MTSDTIKNKLGSITLIGQELQFSNSGTIEFLFKNMNDRNMRMSHLQAHCQPSWVVTLTWVGRGRPGKRSGRNCSSGREAGRTTESPPPSSWSTEKYRAFYNALCHWPKQCKIGDAFFSGRGCQQTSGLDCPVWRPAWGRQQWRGRDFFGHWPGSLQVEEVK